MCGAEGFAIVCIFRIINVVILSSSVVERSAVNRFVVGSNPTWGEKNIRFLLYFLSIYIFEWSSCTRGNLHRFYYIPLFGGLWSL